MSKKLTKSNTEDSNNELPRLKVKVTEEYNDDGEVVRKIIINNSNNVALIAGAQNPDIGMTILRQLLDCLPISLRTDEEAINAALALICGIEPQDELESALATQMAAIHHASLEMLNRVMLQEQTMEGVNHGINRVTKLMRTFTTQMETLQKYRSKGQQTIQVQHVQVNDGGQAIVGNVKTGGGGSG